MTTSISGPAGAVRLPPAGPAPLHTGLPTIGQIVRDVERYTAQALAVIGRDADEASMPVDRGDRARADILRTSVAHHLQDVIRDLAALADLQLPAAGSAVNPRLAGPGETTRLIQRDAVTVGRRPGRHRHEPDRPGAPGLPPRPIDYPRPRLLEYPAERAG